jgi:hypothetical protein
LDAIAHGIAVHDEFRCGGSAVKAVGCQQHKHLPNGVDAHEARSVDEVTELVRAGIADRERPTLINARTIPVGV